MTTQEIFNALLVDWVSSQVEIQALQGFGDAHVDWVSAKAKSWREHFAEARAAERMIEVD